MKKLFLILVAFCLTLNCCTNNSNISKSGFENLDKKENILKAKSDTSFTRNSNIDSIIVSSKNIYNLKILCEVWGFLKYHHPDVAAGLYNFDAELFRIIPQVINASSSRELSNVLEKWVDKFSIPRVCRNCDQEENIVQRPDYEDIFNKRILNPSLVTKLIFILKNSNNAENYYVKNASDIQNPIFLHELMYSDSDYPDLGHRILSLFRYWNMIEYFYPYKHLIGQDWKEYISYFLPEFIRARNKTEYTLIVMKLIVSIHDSHANIWKANPTLESFRGSKTLPFQAQFIQNRLVVTGYYADTLNIKKKIKIGDVILKINGVTVDSLIQKFLPLTSGSNYNVQLRDMPNNYLLRTDRNVASFVISNNGLAHKVVIKTVERSAVRKPFVIDKDSNSPSFKLLSNHVGYLYCGRYKAQDMIRIANLLPSTRGLIIDMRCYPSEFMLNSFVPYIQREWSDFATITYCDIKRPGYFKILNKQHIQGSNSYKGKIVIIVNEYTQSQAEYTTMALQTLPNVTVIGSTTAGADGNVSEIILPGGIHTFISGLGILYPDGTETQRKGIKINQFIQPTIEGIKLNRDELLDKANKIILESK